MDEYVYILAGRVLPERALLDISSVGWVDAVPTQHLLHQCVGLRKDATQRCYIPLLNLPTFGNYLEIDPP